MSDPYIISHERQLNFPFEVVIDNRHETADSILLFHVNPPTTSLQYYTITNYRNSPSGWSRVVAESISPEPMAWLPVLEYIANKYAEVTDDYLVVCSNTPFFLTDNGGDLKAPFNALALLMQAINKELLANAAPWKLDDIKQGIGHVVFVMEAIDLMDVARL